MLYSTQETVHGIMETVETAGAVEGLMAAAPETPQLMLQQPDAAKMYLAVRFKLASSS